MEVVLRPHHVMPVEQVEHPAELRRAVANVVVGDDHAVMAGGVDSGQYPGDLAVGGAELRSHVPHVAAPFRRMGLEYFGRRTIDNDDFIHLPRQPPQIAGQFAQLRRCCGNWQDIAGF